MESRQDLMERQGVAWLRDSLGLDGGQTPFPWQLDLLRRFCRGESVAALDIPTGLGKTATIAVWLVARALGAPLPRRLVYVVDRRAVVDQATEVAEALRAWVRVNPDVAEALGLGSRPLPISTLRGQHVDNREWLEDPSAPAIVVGTIDMVGSRLLFEGYRCSRRMRPYHAGMLGADTLIVLDEAHLVPAFELMVQAAVDDEALKPHMNQREVVPPSRVISMSATGRVASGTLELSDADRQHEVVNRRLEAAKRVRLMEPVGADMLAEVLAKKAWDLSGSGQRPVRVLVFVASRETAQEVEDAVKNLAERDRTTARVPIETELFVGGRRVAERQQAAKRLLDLGMIAGSMIKPQSAVFLIATSAGEVGVDLDADHAVLDVVEWERMVQRLGRVNRRGDNNAEVWVVPQALDEKTKAALAKEATIESKQPNRRRTNDESEDDEIADAKASKKLNDDERVRVERWRRKQASQRALQSLPFADGAYDGSPLALTQLKKKNPPLIEAGSTPAPLHPQLTRAVLESWSMTSLEENTGRPNVRPWLRGWIDEKAQTAVVWRRWLPRKADAKAFFEAAPAETSEVLERESSAVLEWLSKRAKEVGKAAEEIDVVSRLADDHTNEGAAGQGSPLTSDDVLFFILDERCRSLTLRDLNTFKKEERDGLLRDISWRTIVVDARLGGLSRNGLLDARSAEATDISEGDSTAVPFRVREVQTLDSVELDSGWRIEDTFVSRTNGEDEPVAWLVVETDMRQQATTEDGRSTGREQSLDEHQVFTERQARKIGERVALRSDYVELLALAALLHDEGKKAERWQRAFRAPKAKRPLGKTTSRPIQSILARYRHELGSLIYAENDRRVAALPPEHRDLVLHLIAAHHGFARPLLRTDGCDDAPPSALEDVARTIALRFARVEKRWGPWGLAWWETLLRAADQAASRENDQRGGSGG